MKVYISVDIEGVTGVTDWNETELSHQEQAAFARQMTMETLAACQGAIEAGADEIYVKDAHDSARNLDITQFPEEVKVIRGWTCTPESMMEGIDSSFDAALLIGYHSGAGSAGNPLSHTMSLAASSIKINGCPAAEFDLNAYIAAYYGVPVVFVSGDQALCDHARALIGEIRTVGVKMGIGQATLNLSPKKACQLIRREVKEGLSARKSCRLLSPQQFKMEICYKDCWNALRASFYPGMKQIDACTVRYTAKDILQIMTAAMFVL